MVQGCSLHYDTTQIGHRTCHEGLERKYRYSSTLSLTSALDRGLVVNAMLQPLYLRERDKPYMVISPSALLTRSIYQFTRTPSLSLTLLTLSDVTNICLLPSGDLEYTKWQIITNLKINNLSLRKQKLLPEKQL
jgi:hypothetical protein